MPILIVHKPAERIAPVFIIDRGGIDLPLSVCLRVLRERYRNARFVVLDQQQSPEEIGRLLSFGILGFAAYPQIGEHLKRAVHCVARGKLWISSSVLEAYARQKIRHSSRPLICTGSQSSPVRPGIATYECAAVNRNFPLGVEAVHERILRPVQDPASQRVSPF